MHLKELHTLEGHDGRVWHCAWNPRGTILATCGEDTNIRLWGKEVSSIDQESEKWVCQTILTEAHTRTVRSVAWSACGTYLASASFDGTVAIWDKKGGQFECTATLEGHENEVKSVSWSKSGIFLASCSRDKSVWLWDVDEEEDEFSCASVLQAHTQDVKKVVWHPELDILASCSYDNRIKLYKDDGDDDWACFATLASHDSTVWSMSFENLGKRLATCGEDKTIKIWKEYSPENPEGLQGNLNRTTGMKKDPIWKCVCTISGYHTRCVYDVDWNKKNGLLATAGGDDSIKIFGEVTSEKSEELHKNEPVFELKTQIQDAHTQDVNAIAWNPGTESMLASVSDDGNVKLWRLERDSDDNK